MRNSPYSEVLRRKEVKMAAAEDVVRLYGQAHEIIKRVVNDSLTVQEVRQAFQRLLERKSTVNRSITQYGIEDRTVELLESRGILDIGDLIQCEEFRVCSFLVEHQDGYPMTNEEIREAIDRFMRLRARLDELGFNLVGKRHGRWALYDKL